MIPSPTPAPTFVVYNRRRCPKCGGVKIRQKHHNGPNTFYACLSTFNYIGCTLQLTKNIMSSYALFIPLSVLYIWLLVAGLTSPGNYRSSLALNAHPFRPEETSSNRRT